MSGLASFCLAITGPAGFGSPPATAKRFRKCEECGVRMYPTVISQKQKKSGRRNHILEEINKSITNTPIKEFIFFH
jgi:hypothetical protein